MSLHVYCWSRHECVYLCCNFNFSPSQLGQARGGMRPHFRLYGKNNLRKRMKNTREREGDRSLYYICHNVYPKTCVAVFTRALRSWAGSYTLAELVNELHFLVESEGSSPFSQKPVLTSCHKLVQSCPHTHTVVLKLRVCNYHSMHTSATQVVSSYRMFQLKV
jgi:hypothetical protein